MGEVNMKLPRYVQSKTLADGQICYRFNPPQHLVTQDIISRCELGADLQQVKAEAKKLNKIIDEWCDKYATGTTLKKSAKLSQLIYVYKQSNDYKMLRDKTKSQYDYFLNILVCDLGDRRIVDVTTRMAKYHYEEWVKRGVHFANYACTISSRLFRYGIQMEHVLMNPFGNIKRKTVKQRKTVWTREQVMKFLDVAYEEFEYRNVGLIIQMAYEWCQMIGDMRMLEWSSVNLDTSILSLEQSKRRAQVFLPISDELKTMLTQQQKDFGFQPYVAPRPRPVGGKYHPYSLERMSKAGRVVMKLAELPDELRLMDLRRTGTTEMVESGVPLPQIMSVTGHANPQSVKPYLKNTYTSANNALTTRINHVKSTVSENIESDIT